MKRPALSIFSFFVIFILYSHLYSQDIAGDRLFNNVIELRNDEECCQGFFTVFCKPSPVRPAIKFFLQSKDPDVWVAKAIPDDPELSEIPLWTIAVEYEKPDKISAGGFPVLINRNVPDLAPIEYQACRRETEGCHVSPTYGDHAKDWDAMLQKKNEILREAGLTDSSPDRDKVQAIAGWCYRQRKYTGKQLGDQPWHPVEHITHGGFCVFSAHALIAFCSIMEIPARTVGWSNHCSAEVFIDGQWRWVENTVATCDYMLEKRGKGPLFSFSFLEMIAGPFKYGLPEDTPYDTFTCMADDSGKRLFFSNLEAYSKWHFLHGGEGQPQKLVTFQSISELRALYPEKDTLMYVCAGDKPVMYLHPFDKHDYIQNSYTRKIYQSLGLRQCFYLSSSQGVKKVQSILLTDNHVKDMPEDGGAWYYNINGHKVYLRDMGGWRVEAANEIIRESHVIIDIPVEYLNFDQE